MKEGEKAAGWRAVCYVALNIVSASGIVFANKAVFSIYHFKFVFALTWIHTVFTWVGMSLMAQLDLFPQKDLPALKLLPLAIGYVGYIVAGNLSLNLNNVGFYQIMKIAVAPTVVLLELLMYGKLPPPKVLLSVAVVCVGIVLATVTDHVAVSNVVGLVVGVAATLCTAMYQIWAGSKQRELSATSSQLLLAYTPQATVLLGLLVPAFEPVGWSNPTPQTLIGFPLTWGAAAAILVSSLLGVLVSLSTFLVIGATSSLTYNVVGHVKTVIILSGGVLYFGDTMSWKKLGGICIAMGGIIWYTSMLVSQPAGQAKPGSPSRGPAKGPSSGGALAKAEGSRHGKDGAGEP